MIRNTLAFASATSIAGAILVLGSCAPIKKDPYDTGDVYGYPDAAYPSPDDTLYDVPPAFEDTPDDPAPLATTYTVQRGDTLSSISKQHNVSMRAIIDANNISNPNLLIVGQKLNIPGN
ncbi:MAG: LysM domain-containing protein [Akkermansiaceae bacterium]|nr:LysM domain-containing protein [Akkermansiaceae bacterium]